MTDDQNKEIIKQLNALKENSKCADCDCTEQTWASCNIGVFLCISCAGIHRKLGTHITRIKSIQLDSWKDSEIEVMKQTNNIKANEYWEHELPKVFIKPNFTDSIGYKEQWIISKYSNKSFIPKNSSNNNSSSNYNIDNCIDESSIKRMNFDLKEGWIVKKGKLIKNWKKRWLKFLTEDSLAYFKDVNDKAPCGTISLLDSGQVDSIDQVDGKPHCFIISTPKRRFIISCYTGEEMFLWIQNIRVAIKSLNNNSTITTS